MASVGIRELKAHLSEYIARAKSGEAIAITQRGKVVACLTPQPAQPSEPQNTEDSMRAAVRAGTAHWSGRHPRVPGIRLKLSGKQRLSDIVLDERGER